MYTFLLVLNIIRTVPALHGKVPNVLTSLLYQKKDGRMWPHPSFFWYDTDFSDFFLFWKKRIFFQSRCHTKRRMGVALEDIRDRFMWRTSHVYSTSLIQYYKSMLIIAHCIVTFYFLRNIFVTFKWKLYQIYCTAH